MRIRRGLSIIVLVGTLAAAGVGAATNIATGVLPGSWRPFLWLAWPVLGLLLLVVVVVEQVQHRRSEAMVSGEQTRAAPTVVIQKITARSSGLAQGAMFGNVVNHGSGAMVRKPQPDVSSGDDHESHGPAGTDHNE